MVAYLAKRIASSLTVLIVVSLITFLILMLIPGDPALIILGIDANPSQLNDLREALGLNRPWYEQYFLWLVNFLRGNFGNSQVFGSSVSELIIQRLPVTLSLTFFSMIISFGIALGLGSISAIKKDTWIDYFSRTCMQIGMAIPSFWIGIIFIIIFGSWLHWFPISGFQPLSEGFWPFIKSITLPSLVLAIGETGILIRIVRSSMLTSLQQDYMDMTKVKGLPPLISNIKYALRNAMIAPVTVMGMQIAKLFGGTVIVESVFSLPGLGRLTLVAVEQRDIVLLLGIVIFITFFVVAISLLTDIIYPLIDPRINTLKGAQ